ncbi:PREDICTED: transcription factor CP2-like isoform X2 [Branchiostoma belcheri]|uniref:Upstream-binding protein 1 n=1 Tax=Branchiostoma belcheri TaxID=7741 RepID=A0A6P4YRW7_BRABE|nr:PREDICTED: transcription factor CP2-like isoform X2 [Branchiostoma belcheri]
MAWARSSENSLGAAADAADNLTADFDASLSGLGHELGSAAYNMSEVLALPIFKQEGLENSFQYILCAATSPASKINEETVTYLNQRQSYELRLKRLGDNSSFQGGELLKSVVRVVFHDRRLQYTEYEQLAQWRSIRPNERLLDIDIPLSVNIYDIRKDPTAVNKVEFQWDPNKDTSVAIQVHCISTEFTAHRHGGEKGIPFRIQVDSYTTEDEHLHSASCQIKVFKPKGADRKIKTDREKMEKKPDKDKYQPSYEYTILTEENLFQPGTSPQHNVCGPSDASFNSPASSSYNSSFHSPPDVNRSLQSPTTSAAAASNEDGGDKAGSVEPLAPGANIQETQSWLVHNRFGNYVRTFNNFAGADLLRLTREDLVQICGPADGIRLFNALQARAIRPRLTMYVCLESQHVYHAIFLENLCVEELKLKIAQLFNASPSQLADLYRQGPTGIHVIITDQMVQNLSDESCFALSMVKAENDENRYHVIFK